MDRKLHILAVVLAYLGVIIMSVEWMVSLGVEPLMIAFYAFTFTVLKWGLVKSFKEGWKENV